MTLCGSCLHHRHADHDVGHGLGRPGDGSYVRHARVRAPRAERAHDGAEHLRQHTRDGPAGASREAALAEATTSAFSLEGLLATSGYDVTGVLVHATL